jgi:hypothetical protein
VFREAVRSVRRDREGTLDGERARHEKLPHGLPFDQFHRDERGRLGAADVVDGDDVGVVQSRSRARLLLEAGQTLAVERELLRKHFQRDFA